MRKVEEHIIMYLKAIFLPYLFYYVKAENYLEYTIGNTIDHPPRPKRNESQEQYLERITPRQAVRISRYNYNKWYYNNASYHICPPDLSMWEDKSRKTLEKLLDALFTLEDQWEEHYHTALQRQMIER